MQDSTVGVLVLARRWSKIAGYVLAALAILFAVVSFDILPPNVRQLKPPAQHLAPDSRPEQAPQTQDIEQALTIHGTGREFRKTIVMGKLASEDTEWLTELEDWENAVYVVDLGPDESSPTGLKTAMNKAKEVTPYLTYIIEHYEAFPDVAVFLHSHRNGFPKAWHNDAKNFDAVNMLSELRIPTVLDRGFVNLRCIDFPGCPAEVNLTRPPSEKETYTEAAYPYIYAQFFNMSVAEVRRQIPIVASPCCAQFAVSRAQVLKRPWSEYRRWLDIIQESELSDVVLGTVMEYMWHILFGQEAVHCEDVKQCWSNVYGRPEGWSISDD